MPVRRPPSQPLSRREFQNWATGAAATLTLPLPWPIGAPLKQKLRLGVIADLHIGLVEDGADRLRAFLKQIEPFHPDAVVQLGDFAYPNREYQPLVDQFNDAAPVAIHVIGNHDFDHHHDRDDCLRSWGMPAPYYSTQLGGIRMLVLDGNDAGSPQHRGGYPCYVGPKQQEWLQQQLSSSKVPTLILSHQPLAGRSAVDNAPQLQRLLSRFSDRILLCLNGHSHIDQQQTVGGVTYVHCNSASYFWMGGKIRWSRYRDPLHARLTIDPEQGTVKIQGLSSSWIEPSPATAGYFEDAPADSKQVVVPQIRDRTLTPVSTPHRDR